MGREEGGGFGMGNTCIPVVDSFDIWQNEYNYVKFKNKIKFKKKRKLLYIYTMEYYSAIKKNTFESVLMRWMKRAYYTE